MGMARVPMMRVAVARVIVVVMIMIMIMVMVMVMVMIVVLAVIVIIRHDDVLAPQAAALCTSTVTCESALKRPSVAR